MLLTSLFPSLPTTWFDWTILVVAASGVVLIVYSHFIELIHRRDLIRMIGAFSLFVYSITIQDAVFMFAMSGIFLAALIEFIEIYIGIHRKVDDVETFAKSYKRDQPTS